MKKGFYFSLVALMFLTACKRNIVSGHGEIGTEHRNAGNFTAVEIDAPLNTTIHIDSAAQSSLQLKGYKNLLSYIKAEVRGNVLHIHLQKAIAFENDKDIEASITVPSLNAVTIKGSSDVDIHGDLKGDNFKLQVRGAGDIVIDNVHLNELKAELAGAGSLELKNGAINNARYKVSGAGSIEAFGVNTNTADAELLGAGDMELNVAQKLDAEIKGAGSISYKGHPEVTKHVIGIGSLEDANGKVEKENKSKDGDKDWDEDSDK